MFCQRCGTQLPENTTKCPNCGAEYAAENTAAPITGKKEISKISFFTKKKIIITLLIVVILIVGGIAAAVTLSNGSSISVSTSDMLQLADRYLKEMNYEQAIIEFQKILEIEPKNVDAYIGLAEAYVALGDNDRAIEVLEQARRNVDNEQRIENKLAEVNRVYESEPETVEPSTEPINTTAPQTTSAAVTTTSAVPETTVQTTTTAIETTTSTTPAPQTTTQPVTTTAETIDDNTIILNDTSTYFTAQKGDVLKFTVDTAENVEWLSLNPYVAQIDQNGTVTVLHRGRANISAKFSEETLIFTVDSLSENIREKISDAVINGRFGTVYDVIVCSDYLNFGAGSGELIERADFDIYREVNGYDNVGPASFPVLCYNYIYLENNNIGEGSHIMTNESKYNGLTFYNCETAFYEDSYDKKAIATFDTIGKISFNAELIYAEYGSSPESGLDTFYLSIPSPVDNILPCVNYNGHHTSDIVNLYMSDSFKNELKKHLNSNDSFGICKVTIENYSCGYYPLGCSEYANLVEIQFPDGSIYKDNPQSVIIGEEEYNVGLTELDLRNKDIWDFENLRFMTELKVLNLDGTGIYDLRCLVGLTNLDELYIRNNEMLDESEIEMLKKALSNCKIYS